MNLKITPTQFSLYTAIVHRLTGITISENRSSMVESRVQKRLAQMGLNSHQDYLTLLESNTQEQIEFVNLMTTNETYFYRTPRIWDYIESNFLPDWTKKNPNSILNAWSAASSSGEEAYTLGMILQNAREKNSGFQYKILGTDISNRMIDQSQISSYSGRSTQSIVLRRPDLVEKYLILNEKKQFLVDEKIKKNTVFQRHNLFQAPKWSKKFDIILLRNVLIYFTPTDQEKVLENLQLALKESGILIIGESESLTHIKTAFLPLEPFIYGLAGSSLKRAS